MRGLSRWLVVLAGVLGFDPHPANGEALPGTLIEAKLSSSPHAPGDAPDVVVHIPPNFDPARPLDVLVFLHGFDGCARALVAAAPTACRSGEPPHEAWNLAALHAAANTNTILLVPQLAFRARTSRNHRFTRHGQFDAMLSELLRGALAKAIGPKAPSEVRSTTLIAHSGGYHATLAILGDPSRNVPIDGVVLLDALYAGWHELSRWAKADTSRRLVSLYTGQQQTVRGNRRLRASLGPGFVAQNVSEGLAKAVRDHTRLIAQVRTKHADMPRAHFTELIRGLALTAHE